MKMFRAIVVCTLIALLGAGAWANTVASSTMVFEGVLTDNGDGTYSGVAAMVVGGGYDIYGREGASAWFGNDPGGGAVWTEQVIGADHDGWPTWTPDTPDWYQYSLDLHEDGGVQKWAVRNHPGADAANPWSSNPAAYPPKGVPMSGLMDWTAMYAAETDIGAYLSGTLASEIPGGAATMGGGAGAWDMDWSWGSEVVPLEYGGFDVAVADLGGGVYSVTLTPAAPEEVWVDDDFSSVTPGWGVTHFASIQDGIDAVAGSTVNVAAGTYYEGVSVNKSIRLVGAGSGETPASNTIITYDSGQVVSLAASGTTVNPVTLQNLRIAPDGVYGINVTSFISNILLENVCVVGPSSSTIENEVGLKVSTLASIDGLTIKDSCFDNCDYGWYFAKHGDWGPGGSNVVNVIVEGTSFSNNDYKGIYVEKLSEAAFSNCVVDNNGKSDFWNMTWNGGVDINLKGQEIYENISFTDCQITNNGLGYKEGAGLMIKGRGTGNDSSYSSYPASVDGVTITNCDVSGNERGIRLGEPGKDNTSPTNVAICGCSLTGNAQSYTGSDGSTYGGLVNQTTVVTDAELNWWGDASGPSGEGAGSGDAVSVNVDYDPWLTEAFVVSTTEVAVDDDWAGLADGTCVAINGKGYLMGTNAFATIAEGIAAVTDSTVIVAGGTYIEGPQIVLDKDMTITGDPADKPVIMPGGDTGNSGDARGWWLVETGVTVTLENLVFDGDGRQIYQGIRIKGQGVVDNCDFTDIKYPNYSGLAIVPFGDGPVDVSRCTFSEIGRVGVLFYGADVAGSKYYGNTYTGKGAGDWLDYGVEFGGGAAGSICNSTITDCLGVASSDGSTSAGIIATTYYGAGTEVTVTCNVLSGNSTAIAAGYDGSDTTVVTARYNDLSNNTDEGIDNTSASETVDAEKNWWGTAVLADVAALMDGSVDYDPILTTDKIHMAAGGNRLADLQNDDGGWDWPLDDGDPGNTSPVNTIGPIAMGLAKAYQVTGDTDMLAALEDAAGLLLSKTNNFSPSDGYLAAELDKVLGGTAHVDHVNANFYGPLAAGTYDRNGAGTLYDTAGYVNLIRTARAGQGIANLAAWDIGMGLVGAASSSASTAEWIVGVKAEIDELDGDAYYDVIGLTGAVYGLAFVGEDFDPTAGEHAAASSLADLADILVSYQISETGGFSWSSNYVIAYDYNESLQETAYAVLALQEVGGYTAVIEAAVAQMNSVQLCTGGWEGYVGANDENNELTGEALWAIGPWNLLKLDVPADSLYVQVGEDVVLDMDVLNLLQKVVGCQAILGYSSTYLGADTGCVVAGGAPWDELIYNSWDVGSGVAGEIDTAIGIDAASTTTGTDADNTVAVITLEALAEGVTEVVFRSDVSDVESTQLADMNAETVWPSKINSQTIVIDSTAPVVAVTYPNGGELLKGGDVCTITWTATDTYIDDDSIVLEYYDGGAWQAIASGEDNDGSYDWTLPMLDIDTALVRVTASDLAGNSASDESDAAFTIDSTDPTVDDIAASQNSGLELTPAGSGVALQGVVDIAVTVSDNLSGVAGAPTVTVTPNGGVAEAATFTGGVGGVYSYTWTVTSTTPNGTATITVSGLTDNCGNVAGDATDTFDVNKNQIDGTVAFGTLSDADYNVTRDVVFVVTDGGGAVLKTWTLSLDFVNAASVASSAYTLTDVPDGVAGVSAKTAWTLREKKAASLDVDGQATVDFTGGDQLRGGDLNGSNSINILDYAVLKVNWMSGSEVADINGDGGVQLWDYILMKTNWFQVGDPE